MLFQPFFILLAHLVHSRLIEENQYLRVENQILRSKLGKWVRVTPDERARLLRFGAPLGLRLREVISIVRYETFRNWARGYIYKGKGNVGRPAVPEMVRTLILMMARDNPWGYKRIVGELKKLGIEVCRSTVQNILREAGIEPTPNRKVSTWQKFIRTHLDTLIACDFFTKEIWTWKGRATVYIFFFIELGTRRIHLAGMTQYPNRRWVELRAAEVLGAMGEAGFQPDYLIRDRDGKFSEDFDRIFECSGAEVKKTPKRSPICNVYAERMVQTFKREALDHFVVFGRRHLEYLVQNYAAYYNEFRPHQGLGNRTIEEESEAPHKGANAPAEGEIDSVSFCGGLFRHYFGKAA